jgi:hypothetical protein
MAKNIVFITAIGYPQTIKHARFCFKTWEWWCKKNAAFLFIYHNYEKKYKGVKPTWLRYHLFDILKSEGIDFDQVAVVDADTMIRWDCPNFFQHSENNFCGVRDVKNRNWVKKSIRGYRHFFPDVRLLSSEYINAGFMVVNKNHKSLFESMLNFYYLHKNALLNLEDKSLRKGTDQTPFNYLLKKKGIKVKYLPSEYNFTHFVSFFLDNRWLINWVSIPSLITKAYIWHFIGFKKSLNFQIMEKTWLFIKDQYW